MRLHRFYISTPVDGEQIKIADEALVHQWRNVFRYAVGAQVVVFNGDGYDYLCMIGEIGNRSATLVLVSRKKSFIPEKKIALAVSLIKKDNMEWIIEKATELGVSQIFPIISERSEKKSLNLERAEKIAVEASEQCGRGDVPEICKPQTLEVFLESGVADQFESKIAFHPVADEFSRAEVGQSAIFFIGPEGGFSDQEVEMFRQHGIGRRSLGKLILRTETAAIAILAALGI